MSKYRTYGIESIENIWIRSIPDWKNKVFYWKFHFLHLNETNIFIFKKGILRLNTKSKIAQMTTHAIKAGSTSFDKICNEAFAFGVFANHFTKIFIICVIGYNNNNELNCFPHIKPMNYYLKHISISKWSSSWGR